MGWWVGLFVTVIVGWWLVRSLQRLKAQVEALDRSLQAVREELRKLH